MKFERGQHMYLTPRNITTDKENGDLLLFLSKGSNIFNPSHRSRFFTYAMPCLSLLFT